MSFYTSQVGKSSSRYNNSSLYGTNLSSVYADGPPPLDDSTQDEDEDEMDEMVFRDTKSLRGHEKVDKESSKQPDVQPWPSHDASKIETTADDDFGDFSSFADFSSAFGSSKESSSSRFGTNGECAQPTGTFLKNSSQNDKLSNDDDEFGCFSGGEESDFEGFKGFSDGNTEEQNSNKISNGVGTESHNVQNNSLSQHGAIQNNHKRSDFLSDDDDDFDDFQAPQEGSVSNNIQSPPPESRSTQYASGMQSAEMPSIFSDDDDDEFGEFNSSNCDKIQTSDKAQIDKMSTSESDHKEDHQPLEDSKNTSTQQDIQVIDTNKTSENGAITSTPDDQTWTTTNKKDSATSIQNDSESCPSEKQSNKEHQTASGSLSQDETKADFSGNDEFGDFSASFDSKSNDSTSKIVTSNEMNTENDGFVNQSSVQTITDDVHEEMTSDYNRNDDDDFGDFSEVSHTQENINDNDNTKCLSNNNDFGDFPLVTHSKSINNRSDVKTNSPQSDDDNCEEIDSTTTHEQHHQDTNSENLAQDSINSQDDHNEFGDFSCVQSGISTTNSHLKTDSNQDLSKMSKSTAQTEQGNKNDFNNLANEKEVNDDDDFGDFADIPVSMNKSENIQGNDADEISTIPPSQSNTFSCNDENNDKESQRDDSFGNFATFSESVTNKDDDFGDFGEPTVEKQHKQDDSFGDFGSFSNSGDTNSNDNDGDDFGGFSAIPAAKSLDNKEKTEDKSFRNFATLSNPDDAKTGDDKDDDFGEFGEPSSIKLDTSSDDFGDFSASSQSKVPSAQDNASTDNNFATFKTAANNSDNFGDFSSANKSSFQSPSQSTTRPSTGSNKAASIFQPQRHASLTTINNLVNQGFVNIQTDVQNNMIIVMLQHELQSGKPSVWTTVKGAERDGSLRYEWEASDHKLKMLESLSMLPVRIQTSANFKSSGPVQTPLFASGLGLLEPVKGVITPFHHVEELNPSQDPFGAPPEVGVPDLGFGGNGNTVKTDALPGHLEVKDNMDSVSVSSSLDLDFLGLSGSTGDLIKTEGKALYEDDLLGLGMQFSAVNESPKVFNGNKDQKKIFKFNNTTVSLPSDDKNLSEQAKKIVNDFEDLSFMLSKVLMFPLKSKE